MAQHVLYTRTKGKKALIFIFMTLNLNVKFMNGKFCVFINICKFTEGGEIVAETSKYL